MCPGVVPVGLRCGEWSGGVVKLVGAVSVEPGDGAGDVVEYVVDAAVGFDVVVVLAQIH